MLLCWRGGSAWAQFQGGWKVAEIAAADADIVELRAQGSNRVFAELRTEQMRLLYAVKVAITEAAEIETEFIVVDGEIPNAFAGRGRRGENIVGINFPMVDLLGTDAHVAAALLGHEIAHLKLRHGEESQSQAMATGILSVLGGAVLSGIGVASGQALSNLTFAAIRSGYSRDNEREADYLGAIWAVEAGFEVDGAVRLHETMNTQLGAGAASFLSSHPSAPERVGTLRALAVRLSRN